MIPVEIENTRLKLALTIPTGAPVIIANDAMEILRVDAIEVLQELKQLMSYQNSQENQYICWVFCSLILFL